MTGATTLTDAEIRKVASIVTVMAMRQYNRSGDEDRDLIRSDALLGVAKALKAYRPVRGKSIWNYAVLRAQGEVMDGIRLRSPVPRGMYKRGIRNGDVPKQALPALSLHALIEDDHTILADKPDPGADRAYRAVEDSLTTPQLLSALTPRQREAIVGYYWHDMTMAEIAAEWGVTESRVCQILQIARRRIRDTVA